MMLHMFCLPASIELLLMSNVSYCYMVETYNAAYVLFAYLYRAASYV